MLKYLAVKIVIRLQAEIFNFQNNRRFESKPLNRSRSRKRPPPPVTPPKATARSYRTG